MWLAGALANFVITPFDAHGNAGASGGHFAAELICAAETAAEGSPRSMECDVTETSSGRLPNIWETEFLSLYPGTCLISHSTPLTVHQDFTSLGEASVEISWSR